MNKLIVLSFLLISIPVFMQGSDPVTQQTQEPRLYLKTTQANGNFMEIAYEITSPGFVELHLFNPEKEKIWIKGRVTNRIGVDVIQIPRKPLQAGQRYSFVLKYKGQDYSGSFNAQ